MERLKGKNKYEDEDELEAELKNPSEINKKESGLKEISCRRRHTLYGSGRLYPDRKNGEPRNPDLLRKLPDEHMER